MKVKLNLSLSYLFGILFLFFIHNLTVLIESIYIMNLLFTKVDEKILGLFFLLSPLLLFIIKDKAKSKTILITSVISIVCRLIIPFTGTVPDIIVAGLGVASFMILLPTLLSSNTRNINIQIGIGFALGVLTSVVFRTIGSTVDISLVGITQSIGWILGIIAASLLYVNFKSSSMDNELNITNKSKIGSAFAIMSSITLIYFVFSSPGVISRWTEANYSIVIAIFVIMLALTIAVFSLKNSIIKKINLGILTLWNGLFFASLILTILLNTVSFPMLNEAPVVVNNAAWYMFIPMYIMLILSPVLFINIIFFSITETSEKSNTKGTAVSYSITGLFVIILILMFIFTNTWGYVEPISLFFRNKFYLPFLLIGVAIIIPCIIHLIRNSSKQIIKQEQKIEVCPFIKIVAGVLAIVCICSLAITAPKAENTKYEKNELTIMTYNCQQGVDIYGNRNFDKQVSIIKQIDPDIIVLQESDSARISLGNNDVVKYYADNLNYYSYYGPKTVTGTYGTAILSKYPLENTRTIFTFSNVDEVGTSVAEINYNGKKIGVICAHPCGNEHSDKSFTDMLVQTVSEYEYVIAMGDYNMRETETYYSQITEVLNDSWKVAKSNTDKGNAPSVNNRIDYIFASDNFDVLNSEYIPCPQSETDHPAHWGVVRFKG